MYQMPHTRRVHKAQAARPAVKPAPKKKQPKPPVVKAADQAAKKADPLIGPAEFRHLLHVSRTTFKRMRAQGRVIEPAVILGQRMPRWRLSDVEAAIRQARAAFAEARETGQ
jgi:predicted DNA-binding transcriptional regulator AlpA